MTIELKTIGQTYHHTPITRDKGLSPAQNSSGTQGPRTPTPTKSQGRGGGRCHLKINSPSLSREWTEFPTSQTKTTTREK